MALIKKKFIGADQVDQSKIRLDNDAFLRGRNNADSADVEIIKVNASDLLELGAKLLDSSTAAPTVDAMLANKKYVDDQIAGLGSVMTFKGGVDASGALTQLDNAQVGDYYRVTTAGTLGGVELAVGDAIVCHTAVVGTPADLSSFLKIDNTDLDNQNALEVAITAAYDSSTASGDVVAGTDSVQSAIEKVEKKADDNAADIATNAGDIATNAGNISTNTGNISTNTGAITNLQGALGASTEAGITYSSTNYVVDASDAITAIGALDAQVGTNAGDIATNAGNISTNATAISDHISDASGAHAASAISFDNVASGMTATDAQGALDELDGRVDALEAIVAPVPAEEIITLSSTDIANQYVDLAAEAASSASISVTPVGGPMQEKGVDYTVALTGGAGGVTRISFAGDLASVLEAADKLVVRYEA